MITPGLSEQFPHPRFIGFWAMHMLVVWAAIYMGAGLGIRPTWRLFGFTVAATSTWAVSVMAFNFLTGTNYGYLNGKPATASILDLLGPWPTYVVLEIALVTAIWALLTWPWVASHRRGSTADHQHMPGRISSLPVSQITP